MAAARYTESTTVMLDKETREVIEYMAHMYKLSIGDVVRKLIEFGINHAEPLPNPFNAPGFFMVVKPDDQ